MWCFCKLNGVRAQCSSRVAQWSRRARKHGLRCAATSLYWNYTDFCWIKRAQTRASLKSSINAKRLVKIYIRALNAISLCYWKWRCAGGRHYFTRGLVRSVVIRVLLLSAHFRRRRRHYSPHSRGFAFLLLKQRLRDVLLRSRKAKEAEISWF